MSARTTRKAGPPARRPAKAPLLSVVIPVFDEQAILADAVEDLVRSLRRRRRPFEVILAENGSRDRTPEILEGLAERHREVRFLREAEPNYGRALKAGILAARGTFVICEEIDLCDEDFHGRALSLLERGEADLVVGSKVAAGARDERPLLRRAGTLVINGLLKLALDFRGTDTHGLKAFRREALVPIVERCVVEKDLFASELVIRAHREGVRVVELPVVVAEKRPPSVNLLRRVPNVVKNLARLVWVIRLRPDAR